MTGGAAGPVGAGVSGWGCWGPPARGRSGSGSSEDDPGSTSAGDVVSGAGGGAVGAGPGTAPEAHGAVAQSLELSLLPQASAPRPAANASHAAERAGTARRRATGDGETSGRNFTRPRER